MSVANNDNLPFSMMEAMAAGSACVISNIRSIGELIEHEKNGLFVDPSSPREIGYAIVRLIGDNQLRKILTANAKETVHKKCDYEKWMRKVEEYYFDLIKG